MKFISIKNSLKAIGLGILLIFILAINFPNNSTGDDLIIKNILLVSTSILLLYGIVFFFISLFVLLWGGLTEIDGELNSRTKTKSDFKTNNTSIFEQKIKISSKTKRNLIIFIIAFLLILAGIVVGALSNNSILGECVIFFGMILFTFGLVYIIISILSFLKFMFIKPKNIFEEISIEFKKIYKGKIDEELRTKLKQKFYGRIKPNLIDEFIDSLKK